MRRPPRITAERAAELARMSLRGGCVEALAEWVPDLLADRAAMLAEIARLEADVARLMPAMTGRRHEDPLGREKE